jgi:hypothetical protein
VLFLIFNRPDTTQQVFEAIRSAKPSRLYVSADGPRATKPGERERCEKARRIATAVDWDCQVRTLFRDENLGCGNSVAGAVSWFFEHEAEGIILEDDCFPSPGFFRFCSELLQRYRNDTRIMQIGGNNFLDEEYRDDEYSYMFSERNYVWGWATWKRAWDLFDFQTKYYDEVLKKGYLNDCFSSVYQRDYLNYVFDETFVRRKKNVWSYQFDFARIINSGLTIVPNRNLVINLGFGEDATHTKDGFSFDWRLEEMNFPLYHPEFVLADRSRDNMIFNRIFTTPASRAKTNLKRIIPRPVFEKFVKPVYQAVFKGSGDDQ